MIKKITIISSYFAPAWAYGGPPKILFTLAKELIKSDISINVITTDSLGEIRSDKPFEVIEDIKIYRFKNLSNNLAFKANFFYVTGGLATAKKILKDSDRILFSDVRSIFNWQMLGLVRQLGIPYGIFAFGEIPYGEGGKAVIKKYFDKVWSRNFIRKASYLFAQTEHEEAMYNKYFNSPTSKIHLLPLPVEENKSRASTTKITNFKRKWGIKREDKVIIYVGRINYLKGIDILIKSIEILLRNDGKIKLLIIGRDDGYLSKLKDLIAADIKSQIIFTGPLYNEDVETAYFCSCLFCITPRFYEETSTAALQALSCGIPVVVTKEAEIPYFSQYKAGFIVSNETEAILSAINKILTAPREEKRKMAREAKKCIRNHFLAEEVTSKLIDILSLLKPTNIKL